MDYVDRRHLDLENLSRGPATKDTTEKDLLIMFKRCSIRAQNKLVNVVEFLNLCQEPEEAASKFISRVKGQAKVCEFIVMSPTAEDSGQDVSYSDKLSIHMSVRGLEGIQDICPVAEENIPNPKELQEGLLKVREGQQ